MVPATATLVLDGSVGPVQVQAQGGGGITADGLVRTTNTSSLKNIVATGPTSWQGMALKGALDYSLSFVSVNSAATAFTTTASVHSITLDNVSISGATGNAVSLASNAGVTVTNSKVASSFGGLAVVGGPASVGGNSIDVSDSGIAYLGQPSGPISIKGNTITAASSFGIYLRSAPGAIIQNNVIRNTAVAIQLDNPDAVGPVTLGPGKGIDGNVGHSNAHDVISISGRVANSFTWISPPAPSGSDHPLGYASNGMTVDGPYQLTLPSGAVVPMDGSLTLKGATIDGTAGGADFKTLHANPTPTPSLVLTADQSGDKASGALTSPTFEGLPLNIDSGAGSSPWSSQYGLVLTAATFTNGAHVFVTSSGISITGGSISGAANGLGDGLHITDPLQSLIRGVAIGGFQRGIFLHVTNQAPVTVDANNVSVTTPPQQSPLPAIDIVGVSTNPQPSVADGGLRITANTISGGSSGIRVLGYGGVTVDRPVVAGNGVSGSAGAGITLDGVRAAFGPGLDVDNNSGSANAFDALLFGGEFLGDLTWLSPSNSNSNHPLGYAIGPKGAVMRGVHTWTLPAGSLVKVSRAPAAIDLFGTSVDARAGGAVFASLEDDSAGPATCAVSQQTCSGTPAAWGNINLHVDPGSGARGSASLVNATLVRGGIASDSGATTSPGGSGFGLAITGGEIDSAPGDGIRSTSLVSVTGTTVQGSGLSGLNLSAAGNSLSALNVLNNRADGIHLGAGTSSVTKSTLAGNGYVAPGGPFAGVNSAGPLNATCNLVHDNGSGAILASGSSFTQGDLFDNTSDGGFDLKAAAGVTASADWWGHAGGPTPGQVQGGANTSSPLASPAACAPQPTAAVTPPPPSPTTSGSFQVDAAHDGDLPGDSLAPPLYRYWSVPTDGMTSYPVIGGGRVFAVSDFHDGSGQKLYALDLSTGQRAWGPVDLGGTGQFAGAAYDGSTVFTVNYGGSLRAFDAVTGHLKWFKDLTSWGDFFDSPPTVRDGRVYLSSGNFNGAAQTRAFSQVDGSLLWQTYKGSGYASPAATANDVFVSAGCGELADLNSATGAVKWSTPHQLNCFSAETPAYFGGRLYAPDSTGNVIVNSSNGSTLGHFSCDGSPAFDGSSMYCVRAGHLVAEDAGSGAASWSFRGDGDLRGPPTVVGSRVYVRSDSGALYALDKGSGSQVWWGQIAGSSPAVPSSGYANLAQPFGGLGAGGGFIGAAASDRFVVFGMSPPPARGSAPPEPTPVTVAPVSTGDEATSFQVDPGHAGSQPNDSLAGPLARSWDSDLGGAASYPIVVGGRVFVTTVPPTVGASASLRALDIATGLSVWPAIDLGAGPPQPPAFDNGHVFVRATDGSLRSIDATSGAVIWSKNLGWGAGSPPVARGGVVFMTTGFSGCGQNSAIRETDGALLWSKDQGCVGGPTYPAVAPNGDYVAYGRCLTKDYDPATGNTVWNTACSGAASYVTSVYGGNLYVPDTSLGNGILDAATGSLQPRSFSSEHPQAFDAGRGFFLTGGTLVGEDLATSTILWTFRGDGNIVMAPVVANGRVYVGSSAGTLYAIDAVSGGVSWTGSTGKVIHRTYGDPLPLTGLTVAEGTLLVPTGTGLQAYVPGSGPSPPTNLHTASGTQQYTLAGSDGAGWVEIDPALRVTVSPGADGRVLLGGNADLWTETAGFNQDIGIFASDNGGADQLVGWKESGGFAGTYSPNAAFVQSAQDVSSDHTYVFKLKWKANKSGASVIHSGAGPVNGRYSPTRLTAELIPTAANLQRASVYQQYTLVDNDGTSWVEIDPALRVTLSPGANASVVLGGNADLWTETAGFNQDIGIFVSDNGGADKMVGWKESGGFAGTYSPNAAFVQSAQDVSSGHTYVFKLKWKTNAGGSSVIHIGAGSANAGFSPTRLTAELLPTAPNPSTQSATQQYALAGNDGATWVEIDPTLRVTLSPAADGTVLLGGNADLWTETAGFNQDIGIFVSDNGGADQLVGWKESGGFAGTYSPNAAFLQSARDVMAGHAYIFKLKWKANHGGNSVIHVGAGSAGSGYSPIRLTALSFS